MILKTRHRGDRELRSAWPDYTKPSRASVWNSSGQRVDVSTATGLPAVGAAFRLVAGVIATMPLSVQQGRLGNKKARTTTWQHLLFQAPNGSMPAFDWRWDVAMSVETCGNALLQKHRGRGKVVALEPIPMDSVRIYRNQQGEKTIEVMNRTGGFTAVDPDDFVHVRGTTLGDGVAGVSRIMQHRDPLGAMIASQVFEGSYFRNHARPDMAIIFPQGVTREQGQQWREIWEAEYGGPDNAGRVVPLGGGATIQPIPISLRDAQYVEGKQLTAIEIGRIVDVDPVLFGGSAMESDDRGGVERFLRFQLPPRLRRIEDALRADGDLFGETDMYPEFEVNELTYLDPLKRAQVQHQQIQNGSLLVDEARADNGRPPLPNGQGQIPQVVPVGGAPNPALQGEPDDDEEPTNE